jgi:DNA-binding response OmpR family regulator
MQRSITMTSILLVDDNPRTLRNLKQTLEKENYYVYTAPSRMAGLEIARQKLPDLIILNLLAPDVDNCETCSCLRELGIKNIVVLSHQQAERNMIQALDRGADLYIPKPFTSAVLLAKIKSLLRRNTPRRLSDYRN